MKSYIKLTVAVIALIAVIFTGANFILNNAGKGDEGRPYRVEAQRIAVKIENGDDYSLSDYPTITNVEKLTDGFKSGDSDYLVKDIGGTLYRFDYSYNSDNSTAVRLFNISFGVVAAFVLVLMAVLFIRIIRPFEKISDYPTELAKGNLTAPLKESKDNYFGRFLWGLDLLREKLESQKSAELELQKQNKTMVLSLSHDIKTPLGVIELYAKALEKGLYKDEQKKLEVARNINGKCEEIRGYVDGIVKASSGDFLNLEVHNGEFYLSALISQIKAFYTDKLNLLKIDFSIESFSDCILSGDLERCVEVLQNIIENAVKYGRLSARAYPQQRLYSQRKRAAAYFRQLLARLKYRKQQRQRLGTLHLPHTDEKNERRYFCRNRRRRHDRHRGFYNRIKIKNPQQVILAED